MITINSSSLPAEPYFVFDGANINCVGVGSDTGGGAIPYGVNSGVAYTAASGSVYNAAFFTKNSMGVSYTKTFSSLALSSWWKTSNETIITLPNIQNIITAKIKYSAGVTPSNYLITVEQYNSSDQLVATKGYYNTANQVYIGEGWYRIWAVFLNTATTTKVKIYGQESSKMQISIEDVRVFRAGISHTTRFAFGSRAGTILQSNAANWSASASESTPSSMFAYSGSGGYVTIPRNVYLNIPQASSTLERSATIIYAYRYTPGTTYRGYTLCNFSGVPTTYIGGSSAAGATGTENAKLVGNLITSSSGAGDSDNNWRILALSYDWVNKICRFYVNGVLNATSTLATAVTVPPLYLNGSGANSQIDVGMAITYTRSLSEAEIKQIFEIYRNRYGL